MVPGAHASDSPENIRSIAGSADFAAGKVVAIARDGDTRFIIQGNPIRAGDRVLSNDGHIRIRFTDGAVVWLLPHTEFHVQEYFYEGRADGSETGFFGLNRGTVRMVTGAVGRINRSRLQISTPTATIGARGTGGIIEVGQDGTTRVTATSGIWTLTNPVGTVLVPAGTTGVVNSGPASSPALQGETVLNQSR